MLSKIIGDRYQVQQQLGKRAGRRTLLARDLTTQKLVVVKVLFFGHDFEWEDLKLFEREAETLKALSHPAIPRYLDFFELDLPTNKGFALVQTYVEGKSLEKHLKAGRTFTEAEVKQLAKALLEILIYLHGLKPSVIHRDIKPSNIVLSDRSGNCVGNVYLVDFGSVQTLAAREGGTITVVGTYGYMPPEQFGGRTVPASDLYSLGATLIYLVTGMHPADLPQKAGRIVFDPANLSPAFGFWLKRLIEPSLDQRLHSAREALQTINQSLSSNINNLTLNKPVGSKVLLNKQADFIEIIIPPQGFSFFVSFYFLFTAFGLPIACALTKIFVTPDIFTINFFPVLVLLLLVIIAWSGTLMMLLATLFPLFRRMRLKIDQQQISFKYEIFGFKYNSLKPSKRPDINRLEYTKYSSFQQSDQIFEILPRITIWAGIKQYDLGSNQPKKMSDSDDNWFFRSGFNRNLSQPELGWLANELSDWLGLPITPK